MTSQKPSEGIDMETLARLSNTPAGRALSAAAWGHVWCWFDSSLGIISDALVQQRQLISDKREISHDFDLQLHQVKAQATTDEEASAIAIAHRDRMEEQN